MSRQHLLCSSGEQMYLWKKQEAFEQLKKPGGLPPLGPFAWVTGWDESLLHPYYHYPWLGCAAVERYTWFATNQSNCRTGSSVPSACDAQASTVGLKAGIPRLSTVNINAIALLMRPPYSEVPNSLGSSAVHRHTRVWCLKDASFLQQLAGNLHISLQLGDTNTPRYQQALDVNV